MYKGNLYILRYVFVLFVCEHTLTFLKYRATCYDFGMVGKLLISVHSDFLHFLDQQSKSYWI
jgi:hypothetical protein